MLIAGIVPLKRHKCRSWREGQNGRPYRAIEKLIAIVVYLPVQRQQVRRSESRQLGNRAVGFGSPGGI